jgi:hypothetical protein
VHFHTHSEPQLSRQVFLDRNRLIEIAVVGEVGDPESALAQHLIDLVPEKPETTRQRASVFSGIHGPPTSIGQ